MRIQHKNQPYHLHWPAVMMSARAEEKVRDLTILYAAFTRAFHRALTQVLENTRIDSPDSAQINVAEILATDDVPEGIKISFTVQEGALLVCDLWTPPQPELFHVERSSIQPRRPRR